MSLTERDKERFWKSAVQWILNGKNWAHVGGAR